MDNDEKNKVLEFWNILADSDRGDRCLVFSFCMRDIYNISFMNHRTKSGYFISTGCYHPDEIFYLARKTIWSRYNRAINRRIYKSYNDHNAILYMNQYSYENTMGKKVNGDGSRIIPLPIECLNNVESEKENDFFGKKRNTIICIGRFVDFKYYSFLNIIDFLKEHEDYKALIVGYGPYESRLKKYAETVSDRVTFTGKVSQEELRELIASSDIGYAMGTSVLECAAASKPTVIASMFYPSLRSKSIRKDKCIGIFGDTGSYELGEASYKTNFNSLENVMNLIAENYDKYRTLSKEYVKNYFIDRVMEQYTNMWDETAFSGDDLPYLFPRVSKMRFCLKRFLMKRKSRLVKD